MISKEKLMNNLRTKAVKVTFRKKDGTVREMICTLMPHVIDYQPTKDIKRKRSSDLITVWDIEKDDWRCFYLNSLIKAPEDYKLPGVV